MADSAGPEASGEPAAPESAPAAPPAAPAAEVPVASDAAPVAPAPDTRTRKRKGFQSAELETDGSALPLPSSQQQQPPDDASAQPAATVISLHATAPVVASATGEPERKKARSVPRSNSNAAPRIDDNDSVDPNPEMLVKFRELQQLMRTACNSVRLTYTGVRSAAEDARRELTQGRVITKNLIKATQAMERQQQPTDADDAAAEPPGSDAPPPPS